MVSLVCKIIRHSEGFQRRLDSQSLTNCAGVRTEVGGSFMPRMSSSPLARYEDFVSSAA